MSELEDVSISDHGNRLKSIDALRGFVMLIMLVDHVRETFICIDEFDPVDVLPPVRTFYTRLTSAICAPVFVWLTGLSTALFSEALEI